MQTDELEEGDNVEERGGGSAALRAFDGVRYLIVLILALVFGIHPQLWAGSQDKVKEIN